ncbi:DUF1073 domain-containing protein [Candidatus Pacearchaeota archaeon]|nr:DUF1073 domain-containing protein [Candidatus Pacearchaeota archaeon]
MDKPRKDGLYEGSNFVGDQDQGSGLIRMDGWFNLLTGMGTTARDKRTRTSFGLAQRFDRQSLIEIYRGDGLGKRIIQIPAKDMVREWIKISGDPEGLITKGMNELSTKSFVKEALIWARLFGGSIILMLIEDGQELDQPVSESQIRKVLGLQVYDRYDIDWTASDLYSDPKHPKFGLPEIYWVSNRSTGERFSVHDTRVLRFEGEIVPKITQRENQGWGDSIITGIYERLRGLGDGYAGIEGIITEFIIGKLTIKNLQSLIGSKEGTKLIQDRLQIMDMSKHMLNTLLLDEKEEFDRIAAAGTQGLARLIEKLELVLVAVAGLPFIKLFPEQTKGLGSEAAGNIRLYYDDIKSDQEDNLQPQLKILARYIQLAKDGEFKGKELENWGIEFLPLWQPTEKEVAETRELTAKTDDLYFEMGLPGEVIIFNRFGGDTYSSDMVLSEGYVDAVKGAVESVTIEEGEDDQLLDKGELDKQGVEPGIGAE